MNSYIVEPGARADTPPGMLQVSKMTSRFAPRDHPRVAVTPAWHRPAGPWHVVNTTAFPTRSPANPGFVHLNMVLGLSTDPVLVGPHHARAELVENLKGRLVARKTKLPLKLHGGHAGRLTGDQISGPEPDVQRSVATLHHCSHRQPGVLAALAAAQDARAVFKVERLSRRAAVRAGKAVSPAGFLQVGGAGRIIGEKSLELG